MEMVIQNNKAARPRLSPRDAGVLDRYVRFKLYALDKETGRLIALKNHVGALSVLRDGVECLKALNKFNEADALIDKTKKKLIDCGWDQGKFSDTIRGLKMDVLSARDEAIFETLTLEEEHPIHDFFKHLFGS